MRLEQFRWIGVLLFVLWAIALLNWVSGYELNRWFGLVPRSFGGLDGVVLMPFLHGSFAHIASNSLPLVVLGGALTLTARRVLFPASIMIILFGGIAVWVLGKPAVHVGASGLIFGWFGFLLARGVVEKRPLPVVTAIAVFLFYGTMIFGVFPGQPGVSWESHLFGAIAGAAAAYVLRSRLDES